MSHEPRPAQEAIEESTGDAERSPGLLALLGGGESDDGRSGVLEEVLRPSEDTSAGPPADEVLVVPTAGAYEHPEKTVEALRARLAPLGLSVTALPVLSRGDAQAEDPARLVRSARIVYLTDGSPLHLRSVLKESPLWAAIVAAWQAGATLVASGAGAMVLCDPMVDPRGGAYTVGLGLLANLAVFPHHDTAPTHLKERSVELRPSSALLVGIDEATALVRGTDGGWAVRGEGGVSLYGPDDPEGHPHASLIRTL